MSLINDKFLADIIQDYHYIDVDKLKEILSNIDRYQLKQILYESKPEVLSSCDFCWTPDNSTTCCNCHIVLCRKEHGSLCMKSCKDCKRYFCNRCLHRKAWFDYCSDCLSNN